MQRRKLKAEKCRRLYLVVFGNLWQTRSSFAWSQCHKKDYGESDSNLLQLLRTITDDKPSLLRWMVKYKFVSPDIQIKMPSIMALKILREITLDIPRNLVWYSIMVDETTDLSNTELRR